MQRCLELSQLPKHHLGPKSIQFKRTTPGSIYFLAYANKPPHQNRVLDPSHPALHLKPSQFAKEFPWQTYHGFAIRAVPKSLLDKPATVFPDPPFTRAPTRSGARWARDGDSDANASADSEDRTLGRDGRVTMSLMDVASKKVGGRVLRVNVLNKLKTAISLIVTRGADVVEDADKVHRIVFREDDAGAKWVLSDWTYICRPDPSMNLMPYTTLIPVLRYALYNIAVRGSRLELEWGGTQDALRMSELLATLGTYRAPSLTVPSSNLVTKSKALQQLLDELGPPPTVPPGDTPLETMMKRLKEAQASMKAQAEARKSESNDASQPSNNNNVRKDIADVDAPKHALQHDSVRPPPRNGPAKSRPHTSRSPGSGLRGGAAEDRTRSAPAPNSRSRRAIPHPSPTSKPQSPTSMLPES